MPGPRVSWIYKLSKEQLEAELANNNLPHEGTKIFLRQNLITHVRAHPELYTDKPDNEEDFNEDLHRSRDLQEIEEEFKNLRLQLLHQRPAAAQSSPVANPQPTVTPFSTPPATVYIQQPSVIQETAKIMDQMRKWNCHFDGKDLYAFLERLHELQRSYNLSDQQILNGFPELLRGDAQLWHRNYAPGYRTLAELEDGLRKFYLSPGELRHLDRQIHNRMQKSTEDIRTFAHSLLTLMRRRGGFTNEQQVETMYYNMCPEYRLHIRRDDVNSTPDIIQRVEELLEVKKQCQAENSKSALGDNKKEFSRNKQENKNSSYKMNYNSPATSSRNFELARTDKYVPRNTSEVNAVYDRTQCCWRCKERGHSRFKCPNAQKLFCSHCGRDNVYTRDCQCHASGNAPRAGLTSNTARPQQ